MGERYKYSATKMAVVTLTRIWVNEIRIEENFRRNERNKVDRLYLRAKMIAICPSPRDWLILKKIPDCVLVLYTM